MEAFLIISAIVLAIYASPFLLIAGIVWLVWRMIKGNKKAEKTTSPIKEVTMDNPEVKALIDEVVNIIDDCTHMGKVATSFDMYSLYEFEGVIWLRFGRQSIYEIVLNDVGDLCVALNDAARINSLLSHGDLTNQEIDALYDFVSHYGQFYNRGEKRYEILTKSTLSNTDRTGLHELVLENVKQRCPLAIIQSNQMIYTKDIT